MDTKELKQKLYNQNYDEWNEFIEDYDFPVEYDDLYLEFLLLNKRVDDFYLSSIVKLSTRLKFYHKELYERYFDYLFQRKGFFTKWYVLDYLLNGVDEIINNKDTDRIFLFLDKYVPRYDSISKITYRFYCYYILRKIYKNDEKKSTYYFDKFYNLLKRCRIWTSITIAKRILENFEDDKEKKLMGLELCKEKVKKYHLNILFNEEL